MPIGTIVGTLTAEDPDHNSSFIYSISGNELNFLILDSKLLTGKVFDFENQSVYELEIMVSDNGFPVLNVSLNIHCDSFHTCNIENKSYVRIHLKNFNLNLIFEKHSFSNLFYKDFTINSV